VVPVPLPSSLQRHRVHFVKDRRFENAAKNIAEYWQLWVFLFGLVAACVRFYYAVNDLTRNQENQAQNQQIHRDDLRNQLEAIRIKQAVDEVNIEWLKARKDK
jgi:hypothetical protein